MFLPENAIIVNIVVIIQNKKSEENDLMPNDSNMSIQTDDGCRARDFNDFDIKVEMAL